MKKNIHTFTQGDLHILLDVNSGAVHLIDGMTQDILQVFEGGNDQAVLNALSGHYDRGDITEALEELHQLMDQGLLFAPELSLPDLFRQKPVVKSLCLHVAHDCNLRCGYCFAGTGAFGHQRGLMDARVGKKAVDFLIEHGGDRRYAEIDFFGGEPLLNMETVRVVTDYSRQRGKETGKSFRLTLTTNAVLLDDAIIQYLNDNDISVVLSLDGRRQTHDRMRPRTGGAGSFDECVQNITKLVQSRNDQDYYVRGTFTAWNLDFAADVLAMADLGFSRLSVEPVVAKGAAYGIESRHLPELFRQYDLLTEEYLRRKEQGAGFDFFHFNVDLNNGPCVAKRLSGCGAGHEYFAVTPDGDLYPCHQFVGRDGFCVGNVFEGIQRPEIGQRFRDAHVLTKEACRSCWAKFYCSGGCHANADLFHGRLDQPYEIGCELQRKRLECAIYIQAKLAPAQGK